MKVVPIVEGHGDVAAVGVLLRRLATAAGVSIEVSRPIRIPRNRLVKEPELRRAVEFAGRQTRPGDAVLVLIDADDDCPALLAPRLLGWAKAERADRRIAVVLARREFEAWFIAAADSLVANGKLVAGTQPPADAETIPDAKGWLKHAMRGSYSETVDQPALAALFDLDAARRCSSFAKMCRDFVALTAPTPPASRTGAG